MATIVNNPSNADTETGVGTGMILGIVVAILVIIAFIVFGGPYFRGNQPQTTNQQTPAVQVTLPVNGPAGSGAANGQPNGQ